MLFFVTILVLTGYLHLKAMVLVFHSEIVSEYSHTYTPLNNLFQLIILALPETRELAPDCLHLCLRYCVEYFHISIETVTKQGEGGGRTQTPWRSVFGVGTGKQEVAKRQQQN